VWSQSQTIFLRVDFDELVEGKVKNLMEVEEEIAQHHERGLKTTLKGYPHKIKVKNQRTLWTTGNPCMIDELAHIIEYCRVMMIFYEDKFNIVQLITANTSKITMSQCLLENVYCLL
jgi:hypothetical protein